MIVKSAMTKAAAVALLVTGINVSQAQDAVPTALKPPAGYVVALTAKATGVQIYNSTAEAGAAAKWTFEAPLAELKGRGVVIHHYAGPSWEAVDGSKVSRDMDTPVTTVPAKQATSDIPWLLIKVQAEGDKQGTFSQVVYIQRVNTKGGKAPAQAPIRMGTNVGVAYRATYYCYGRAD